MLKATAVVHSRGRVAQWITRLTTDQKIPGSNPGMLAKPTFYRLHSADIMALLPSLSARLFHPPSHFKHSQITPHVNRRMTNADTVGATCPCCPTAL